MEFNLSVGLKGVAEKIVTERDTAKAFGSGSIDVFATPLMIGLMEHAALQAVDGMLPSGFSTVGIHVNINHLAATRVGLKVTSEATLIEIDGKKLTFRVEAFDENKRIGEGKHTRFIVDSEKFNNKVMSE